MATLTIRNIDPQLHKELRVRAAHHGRSMEAELRQILKEAVNAPSGGDAKEQTGLDLAEAIRRRFAPYGGVELEPFPRTPMGPPPEFGK
jgi:antitoxin FitA